MIIHFSRTGGIAPINISCQLDTDHMDPAEATRLAYLVEDSGIMQTTGATIRGYDMHYFNIRIETDGRSHSAKFDQVSIPPKVKTLFDYLMLKCHTQQHDEFS